MKMEEAIQDAMPIIDEMLGQWNVDIRMRPIQASSLFVEQFLRLKNDEKITGEYANKPWFKEILKLTISWYHKRYSNFFKNNKIGYLTSLALIYNTPFLLTIPQIIVAEDEKDKITKITYPDKKFDNEIVWDFVVDCPDISELEIETKKELEIAIEESISTIRRIYLHTISAKFESPESGRMANSIIKHIETAANNIANPQKKDFSLGIWEIFFALEKTFKSYLNQRGVDFPKNHNIKDLLLLANSNGVNIDEKKLDPFPNEKEIIKYRYHEIDPPKMSTMINSYFSALEIINICTSKFSRKVILNNATFFIKKAIWQ